MRSNVPKILAKISEKLTLFQRNAHSVSSLRQSSEQLVLPKTANAKFSAPPSSSSKHQAQLRATLQRRRRQRWSARTKQLRPIREVIIERPSKDELELHRAVCVGNCPPASYRIAARLLRQGSSEWDVSKRLEIPLAEIHKIQEICSTHYESRVIPTRVQLQIQTLFRELEPTLFEQKIEKETPLVQYLPPELSNDFIERALLVL